MYYDYYLYYLSYLNSLYNGYPLIIRLTVVMVMALAVVTILGVMRLLYIGYRISRRERRIKKTQKHFEEKLSFVMRNSARYDVDEIRELLQYDVSKSHRWKADVLTDVVLSVKNAAYRQGELNEINYKNCLEALRLTAFWEKKIRTSAPDKRKEALQIVGEIGGGVNSGVLSKSTFHKNKYLRKTARDLYTGQDNYHPYRFMEDNFDEAFTQIDKLRLHATLIKRSKEGKLPNLLRWISSSKNPAYIVFILREITFFKQYEALPTLVAMLDRQENKDVRAQIVLTLGELEYFESLDDLVARYPLESTVVREAIIKTMGKLRGTQSLDFLIEAYLATDDVNAKLLIARSIRSHGPNGEQILHGLQEEARRTEKVREDLLLEQVFSERAIVSI
ncbi:HEAT repeat protein [Sphingobacterium allocomposti]|uniref:HEAT repeat protein n=1 Tax=Sphingobacterium allocomposti TaxID=415956 RepID=A0A5S5CXJ8_9SPHI|nr:HEAT repeat domain-containing protein [Sphingobacterium composti Yoo et al. 2007 non Ten et al. 2007]TYP87824.1 HEAT repeat protein [Sphingobacterium composti Yoo et al. 2007 non Ten et al. 2007]